MPRDERAVTDPTCRAEVRHRGPFERPWRWVVDRKEESFLEVIHKVLTLTRRMRTVFSTTMMTTIVGVEREEQNSVPSEEASRIGRAEFYQRTFSFRLIFSFQPFLQLNKITCLVDNIQC